MIKIEDFDSVFPSGMAYGGHSGSKKGIILYGERWFLKYPRITSPISEYLGSHIYKLMGFDTHDTKLGFANGKIFVACRDFLEKNEIIFDYNSLKNDYDETVERKIEELSSSSRHDHTKTDLYTIIIIMNENYYFKKVPMLKERFWDMFIVDAFLSNNDRNDNNWGLILNQDTMELRLSPIFDNGASFYSKSSDERISSILGDDFKIKQVVYDSCVSAFSLNGKTINPLKFIESMKNGDCNKALLRVFKTINLEDIASLFASIPLEYKGINVLTKEQRELYYRSLEYKYKNVFEPTYNILRKEKENC